MVARYGGEEFAILLPNTNHEGVIHALKKVQKYTAETHFKHGDTIQPMPTFSAGIALYASGEDPATLIERADHASTKPSNWDATGSNSPRSLRRIRSRPQDKLLLTITLGL